MPEKTFKYYVVASYNSDKLGTGAGFIGQFLTLPVLMETTDGVEGTLTFLTKQINEHLKVDDVQVVIFNWRLLDG
jgi:hypothetical protein